MKKYKVEIAHYEWGEECGVDLVNIEDENDRLMAGQDEFFIGTVVDEDQIEMKWCPYIDENENYGKGEFAHLKKSK